MLVDKFARQKRRLPEYVLETFYGRLEHIFSSKFVLSLPTVFSKEVKTSFLQQFKAANLIQPRHCHLILSTSPVFKPLSVMFLIKQVPHGLSSIRVRLLHGLFSTTKMVLVTVTDTRRHVTRLMIVSSTPPTCNCLV